MNERSRRKVLAVGTALGAVTATTALAGTFGNPDQPAQGIETTQKYLRGAVDPGPQTRHFLDNSPRHLRRPQLMSEACRSSGRRSTLRRDAFSKAAGRGRSPSRTFKSPVQFPASTCAWTRDPRRPGLRRRRERG
jgi:hypothetical protein